MCSIGCIRAAPLMWPEAMAIRRASINEFPQLGKTRPWPSSAPSPIIKPDATARNLTGKINGMIEAAGLKIISGRQARALGGGPRQEVLRGARRAPLLQRLGEIHDLFSRSSCRCSKARERNQDVPCCHGRDEPSHADAGTIRKECAERRRNSVHGSDSAENAAIEIALNFAGFRSSAEASGEERLAMITPAHVATMARYNAWQNRSLYTAADGLTDEARKQDRGAFFKSIRRACHLLFGDRIWLHRFAGTPVPKAKTMAKIGYRDPRLGRPQDRARAFRRGDQRLGPKPRCRLARG